MRTENRKIHESIYIDIGKYVDKKATALVGYHNGKKMMADIVENLNLFTFDDRDYYTFVIPERIITMNKSWFLGMFDDRILHFGNRKFREHYVFNTSSHIHKKIDKYIDNALLSMDNI